MTSEECISYCTCIIKHVTQVYCRSKYTSINHTIIANFSQEHGVELECFIFPSEDLKLTYSLLHGNTSDIRTSERDTVKAR